MKPQDSLDKLDSMVSGKLGRWSRRNPPARQLFTNPDALLEVLQWLPKKALDKCREVCSEWNEVIDRNSTPNGQVLPQRLLLDYFCIGPALTDDDFILPDRCLRQRIERPIRNHLLDRDGLWMNGHPRIDLIKKRARAIFGELVYPHDSPHKRIEVRVRVNGHDFIEILRNKFGAYEAYFFARLVFALGTASFEFAEVDFVRTPELVGSGDDGDGTSLLPRGYLNPKVFTLPNLKPLQLVSRYFSSDRQPSPSAAVNVVNTLSPMIKCEALWSWGWEWIFDYLDFADTDYLQLLAVARPLNAPAIIYARLDLERLEKLIKFFESDVPSLASMVPSVYVRFAEPLPPWPARVLWDAGADSRRVNQWGDVYEYTLSNRNSGEMFRLYLHGARNPDDISDDGGLHVQRMDVVIRDG